MTQRFGAAISEHPLLTHATGEVVGQVLDAVGEAPSLAIVFVTSPGVGALEDICSTIRSTLRPEILLGVSAVGVVGNQREVEEVSAVSLWAGRIDGLRPVRLAASRNAEGWSIAGFPKDVDAGTLLVLADPFSFPADGLLRQLQATAPGLTVIGGLASAANVAGGNRLVFNEQLHRDGAVGVVFPPGVSTTLVSQGCRPVGDPLTVTGASGNLITELAGQPAATRLREMIAGVDEDTRALMYMGLHVGIVVNEQKLEFRRGDFLIRGVMGVYEASGAVAVGDLVEVGQTVQFQVRDADTADEDLSELLQGRSAEGALLFTCNGRGSHLFDEPDHDAAMVHEALRGAPLAGMFCGGEIGPVGNRNYLHGFTASVLMFD